MARKSRVNKEGGQRARRKYVPWESDSVKPGSPSSQEAMLSWFAMPGNVERWRRQKHTELVKEIVSLMRSHGIKHREAGDVSHKLQTLANAFASAVAHLGSKGQVEAFDRGEADPQTVDEVSKICPQYQQLLPIFGASPTMKKAQILSKNTATDKSNGAKDVAGGMNNAAGKWKESLEKDRGKATAGAVGGSKAKPAGKGTDGKPSAAEKKGEQEQSAAAEKPVVVERAAAANGKQSTARAAKEVAEESKTSDARTDAQHVDVEEEEEGVLADVEDGGEKRTRAEKKNSISVPEEVPASDDSDSDSSDEEQADPDVKDKNAVQEKKQHQAGETSSSEEEDSDEDREESASEEEVDDGEERIPLAQPDEETEEEVKEEPAEHNEVDEDDTEESDEEVEESAEEEEVEEEPDTRAHKAKESSEDSDSSSSESESEGAENEPEDTPTSTKADSEQHEEQDNGEPDDEEMEEEKPPTQKAVEQSDSAQERTPRKRRSSVELRAPSAKRVRRDTSDVTRDLKRAAFVEQAKQEQVQREELFQLERSKLECELAAKQVQLAMEKALARRTLLGAGIDPAEVDRVLQL